MQSDQAHNKLEVLTNGNPDFKVKSADGKES
jgi:hypothetical protein